MALPQSNNAAAPVAQPGSLSFVENAGQTDANVRYMARGGGFGVYLTRRAAVLSLMKGERGAALTLGFVGANPGVTLDARTQHPGTVSYLRGRDPAAWKTGLPTYGEVRYTDLWPGIDMVVRGSGGALKYEFRVHPGARVGDIGLRYRGADGVALGASGGLLVQTPLGVLRDAPPSSYQTIGGKRVPVNSRYDLQGARSYGFALGTYDPSRTLVIDPALAYSTFLGGSDTDAAFEIAVDSAGSAYLTGYTYSPDFPTTAGAYDATPNGDADVFVSKIDSAGSLVYSTYLGGANPDFANGIAVDSAGNAYVTGNTPSDDFPTTTGAYQTAPDNSPSVGDAFVTKLNATGTGLSYSTFLGGFTEDRASDIAVDATGSAYVTGGTGSSCCVFNDFPTTAGAYDTTPTANGDAFLAKLDPTGSALAYSTYLGGGGSEVGTSVALDQSANAYVEGQTLSSDFPTTAGAADTTANGDNDIFVAKVNASGAALSYSTYLGGATTEFASGIAVDPAGSAYATGETFSQNFPTTPGAFDTTIASFDTFVTKLDPAGSSLSYSSLLGGQDSDLAGDVTVDPGGSAYVTGYTFSTDFPTTAGSLDTTIGGSSDAFVTRFDPTGASLSYSMFLGGGAAEVANGVGLDAAGSVYIGGLTDSADFPTTAGAHDSTFNGGAFDVFVTKLDLTGPPASTPGCATSDHGRIVAQNGDLAMFTGRSQVSVSGEPSGTETYRDRGPAERLTMRSTAVDALVCDHRDASIIGRALVDGEETTFQIDLHDGGGRRRDTYRIVLGTGYDSGERTLRSGRVKVR